MTSHRCIHFNGIQKPCAAGIDPMSVRDKSGPGMATFPCIDIGKPCAKTCGSQRMMTAQEEADENAAIDAQVARFLADLASGKCPICQEQVAERRQVGRCQYARPCGHRLGQHGDEGDDQ